MNGYRVLFASAAILFVFFDVANAGGGRDNNSVYVSWLTEDKADLHDANMRVDIKDQDDVFNKPDGQGGHTYSFQLPTNTYEASKDSNGNVHLDNGSISYTMYLENQEDASKFKYPQYR